MKRVYLDSNSAMPVDGKVLEEMMPFFKGQFGNPSSIHELGREPRRAMEKARAEVASLIVAEPSEIYFTSGATESINTALRGPLPFIDEDKKRILISEVDHRSVRAVSASLESKGYEREFLPVDTLGRIDIQKAEDKITDDVAMVSVPYASFEVGTVQPLKRIVDLAHEHGSLVHVDLTTSAFQMPMDVDRIPVDLATLSSVDLMGPKGMGALYVKKGTKLTSLLKGGGHERGLRSGSENVAGIVGMGAAARISKDRMHETSKRLTMLRDRLKEGLLKIPDSHLNGDPVDRLPNNMNVRFDYIEGESMLLLLDMNGISVSSGSACSQKNLEASKTLLAMGLKHEQAHGSLQFTLGPYNDEDDVDHVVNVMPDIVQQLREMSPIYNEKVK